MGKLSKWSKSAVKVTKRVNKVAFSPLTVPAYYVSKRVAPNGKLTSELRNAQPNRTDFETAALVAAIALSAGYAYNAYAAGSSATAATGTAAGGAGAAGATESAVIAGGAEAGAATAEATGTTAATTQAAADAAMMAGTGSGAAASSGVLGTGLSGTDLLTTYAALSMMGGGGGEGGEETPQMAAPVNNTPAAPDLSAASLAKYGKKRGRASTILTGGKTSDSLGGTVGKKTLTGL